MNNKGFTLIEIISVVALLALVVIISVPLIGNAGKNIKKKALQTKIDNIEKASILYGQKNRYKFTLTCNDAGEPCDGITGECICYENEITVNDLITNNDIEADDQAGNIYNPVNEEKKLNECKIQIYKKYGKIYAIYDNGENMEVSGTNSEYQQACWYE